MPSHCPARNGTRTDSCAACGKVKLLRKLSDLCYYCHGKAESQRLKDADPEGDAQRQKVRLAYYALMATWGGDDVEAAERAAFDLIEAVETILGKV